MNMSSHAADTLRCSAESANSAAEVIVQPVPPGRRHHRIAVFRGEENMLEQARIRGWHSRPTLTPLPGCPWGVETPFPVVPLRATTGYTLRSLRLLPRLCNLNANAFWDRLPGTKCRNARDAQNACPCPARNNRFPKPVSLLKIMPALLTSIPAHENPDHFTPRQRR